MFRMSSLAAVAVLIGLHGLARAACPQPVAEPMYACVGGLCARNPPTLPPCPNSSLGELRACSEAYYYSTNLPQMFGPLQFKHVDIHEIRWSVNSGDYNSGIGLVSSGSDCPETERNAGLQSCPVSGGPSFGNPINTGIGNKYQDETDYIAAGDFPLEFHRYYNSVTTWGGAAGKRWTHSYSRRLVIQSSTEIKLLRDDGEVFYFFQCGSAWCPTADEAGTLTQFTNGSGSTTSWKCAANHSMRDLRVS